MSRYLVTVIALLFAALISGCSNDQPEKTSVTTKLIRIAPLPDLDPEITRNRYQPVVDYIANFTGIKTELIISDSYAHLLDLFHNKKIDIANFGAVTFLKARKTDGAVPMVMRNIDPLFTSVVLVRAEANEKSLSELKDKHFAFGSSLSTSGHLMPRYFFSKEGITPETFFSNIDYSGAHDKTAFMVRDKQVYAGVSNTRIIRQMYNDGRLNTSEVRILWESPSYTDYLWASQPDIAPEIKNSIEEAFLNLDASNPAHKTILARLGAKYFITANQQDFLLLEKILDDQNYQKITK